jgi:hypothetical protein
MMMGDTADRSIRVGSVDVSIKLPLDFKSPASLQDNAKSLEPA